MRHWHSSALLPNWKTGCGYDFMSFVRRCLLAAALLALASPALAGPTLERVRSRGVVRCAAVARPGLAEAGSGGGAHGLAVDVCRAVASAVLGAAGRIEFRLLVSEDDFVAVQGNQVDLSFLSASEIIEHDLAAALVPGPAVFLQSVAVAVPKAARFRHVEDLADASVCFLIASSAERSLEHYFQQRGLDWIRHAYSEQGEMRDGFAARQCQAIAAERTELAGWRAASNAHLRLLPESLTVFPIVMATGTGSGASSGSGDGSGAASGKSTGAHAAAPGDAQWTALAQWTVATLVSAARPDSTWYAGGWRALPLDLRALGLQADWQRAMLAAVGNYGQIFERNVGSQSALRLAPELNRNGVDGGGLLAPFVE